MPVPFQGARVLAYISVAIMLLIFIEEEGLLEPSRFGDDHVRPSAHSKFRLEDLELSRFSVDLSSKPAYVGDVPSEEVAETVELATVHGQRFACRVGSRRQTADSADEGGEGGVDSDARGPLETAELLRPLESICLYRVFGWWTYEYCHMRHVRQYHVRPTGEVEDENLLGSFSVHKTEDGRTIDSGGNIAPLDVEPAARQPFESVDVPATAETPSADADADIGSGDDAMPEGSVPGTRARAKRTAVSKHTSPHNGAQSDMIPKAGYTWEYSRGTSCGVGSAPRKTIVQIRCHPDAGDHIASVVEPSTCVYHVVINTPRLCSIGLLDPLDAPADPIVCHPLATTKRAAARDHARRLPRSLPMKLKVEVTPADLMASSSKNDHYANVVSQHMLKSMPGIVRSLDIEIVLIGSVEGSELVALMAQKKADLEAYLETSVPERLRAMQSEDYHFDESTQLIRMERYYKIVLSDGLSSEDEAAADMSKKHPSVTSSVGVGELAEDAEEEDFSDDDDSDDDSDDSDDEGDDVDSAREDEGWPYRPNSQDVADGGQSGSKGTSEESLWDILKKSRTILDSVFADVQRLRDLEQLRAAGLNSPHAHSANPAGQSNAETATDRKADAIPDATEDRANVVRDKEAAPITPDKYVEMIIEESIGDRLRRLELEIDKMSPEELESFLSTLQMVDAKGGEAVGDHAEEGRKGENGSPSLESGVDAVDMAAGIANADAPPRSSTSKTGASVAEKPPVTQKFVTDDDEDEENLMWDSE